VEYKNTMLRKIFCSNMETLTGGLRKFQKKIRKIGFGLRVRLFRYIKRIYKCFV